MSCEGLAFWGSCLIPMISLICLRQKSSSDMPPFRVTSAEVAIICSEWCMFILRKTVWWLGNTCSIAIWVRTGAYLSCIWPANEVMFLGMECTWCLIWRTPTYWKVWRNRSILFDILLETRGREGCKKITSFHCVVHTKRLSPFKWLNSNFAIQTNQYPLSHNFFSLQYQQSTDKNKSNYILQSISHI